MKSDDEAKGSNNAAAERERERCSILKHEYAVSSNSTYGHWGFYFAVCWYITYTILQCWVSQISSLDGRCFMKHFRSQDEHISRTKPLFYCPAEPIVVRKSLQPCTFSYCEDSILPRMQCCLYKSEVSILLANIVPWHIGCVKPNLAPIMGEG